VLVVTEVGIGDSDASSAALARLDFVSPFAQCRCCTFSSLLMFGNFTVRQSLVSQPPSPAQPARHHIPAYRAVEARPAAIRPSNAACPLYAQTDLQPCLCCSHTPRRGGIGCTGLQMSGAPL
jgi:hypothetical protein